MKDQGNFSLLIIVLILVTVSLDNVWISLTVSLDNVSPLLGLTGL